jgi:fructokinase
MRVMRCVVTSGEMLVDMIPVSGRSENGKDHYAVHPGGAPANVAIGLARLKRRARFIGKLSSDSFGRMLLRTLRDNRVDTRFLPRLSERYTAIALVSLDEEGNREFSFYQEGAANWDLNEHEVTADMLDGASVCHVGLVSLAREPSRTSTLKLIDLARARRKLVSCDLNVRPQLWDSEEEMREYTGTLLERSDIFKCSEEELSHIDMPSAMPTSSDRTSRRMKTAGIVKLSRKILESGPGLVIVTMGSDGAVLTTGSGQAVVPAMKIRAVDTTGAGDAFTSGILCRIMEEGMVTRLGISSLQDAELVNFGIFANTVAGISCERYGGIESMPYLEEVRTAAKRYRPLVKAGRA